MLLTYNEFNKQLGYVQGMSDLLSPIYAVMQDDAVAFWGFAKFMDRMVLSKLSYSINMLINSGAKLFTRPIWYATAATDP